MANSRSNRGGVEMPAMMKSVKRKAGRPPTHGTRHAKFLLRAMQVLYLFHPLRDAGEKYEHAVKETCRLMKEKFATLVSKAEVYRILAMSHDADSGVELAVRDWVNADGCPSYALYFRDRVHYLHPSIRRKLKIATC